MILGALVTYKRPQQLGELLNRMATQTRRLDWMVIVDNDAEQSAHGPLQDHLACGQAGNPLAAGQIDYLPQSENSGAAGGWAVAQKYLVERAHDDDWIVMMDDDDPPLRNSILEEREAFASRMLRADPHTAGVGDTGAFFNRTKARLRRVADDELSGPVSVDYLGSNHFPFYRVGIMRELGPFFFGLFLGYTELEYSLRTAAVGYSLYVDGDSIMRRRKQTDRLGLPNNPKSSLRTDMPPWRVYYTTRNLIWMLRTEGHKLGALRMSFRRGLGRGVSQLLVSPSKGRDYLKAGLLGTVHGWRDSMGPTIDPDDPSLRIRRNKLFKQTGLAFNPIIPLARPVTED